MSAVAADPVARLRASLAPEGVDALVVSGRTSVRYLTGYAGSNGLVCLAPGEQRFLTDFRYATSVEDLRERWDVRIVEQDLLSSVATGFGELVGSGLRVGFEASDVSYSAYLVLAEAAAAAGCELVPTTGVVERLRAVKTPDEIERIRAAARIADGAYTWLVEQRLCGRTERDVAWGIEMRLRELGADDAAFPPIVASAGQGALPHGQPRDVAIESGTLVVVDLGARLDGYRSDCTRTFATGALTDEARAVYEVVAEAQRQALALVRPGTPCPDVHAAARRVIDDAGYGALFNHGTGHGIGLDVHEAPRFRNGVDGVLEPGNVVTVEPGVYVPGQFGVRIEDLVVVTDDGREVLSQFPKSLIDAG
jgi:Xaa-Pro aminopeptidase